VLPAAVAGAQSPPRDLHFVDGHWTAWNPPQPPAEAEVHVIERGDTLWDLAARFYGDPYLWPQLWEQNRYILDAHWIYPGDPLVVGVDVEAVESLAELVEPAEPGVGEEGAGDGSGILTSGQAAGAPVPLGSESDIYCSGFIDADDRLFPHSIIGSEYGVLVPRLDNTAGVEGDESYTQSLKEGLMSGDIVYLDGGRAAGLEPGLLLSAVAPEELVRHPVNRRLVGRFYRLLGRVQVLSVQEDTAIAEIVHTCDPINVGALLEPFSAEPVPLGRMTTMRPVNLPAPAASLVEAPIILRAEDQVIAVAEDSVVYIDRGESDDVVPGDIFTIYRMNRTGLPPVVLGELAVLSVHPSSSVARILRSRYTVYVGDRLERKQ
jgi:hypothetical protein